MEASRRLSDGDAGVIGAGLPTHCNPAISWRRLNGLPDQHCECRIKVGRVNMSSDIVDQIAKDAEIISLGRAVEWHFYTSPVTGLGGPSAAVEAALRKANIKIVMH